MLDSLIAQLNSTDSAARRQAIIALGRSKDAAALPALARIFREDPETELRELARKAAQYIRQQNEAAAKAADTPSDPAPVGENGAVNLRVYEPPKPAESAAKATTNAPVRGREYTVSAANKTRAKALVESALGASLRGNNAQAMKDLGQAITADPNLINDPYFGNVAGSVTGQSGDEAVRMILDGQKRTEFVKAEVTKTKQEVKAKQIETAKSSDLKGVGFEMAIFIVINIIFPVVFFIVIVELIRQNFGTMIADLSPRELRNLGITDVSALNMFTTASLPLLPLIISGFISAIGLVFTFVFQMVFIHLASILIGGTGTFLHLLEVMLQFSNRIIPTGFIVLIVAVLISVLTFDPVTLAPSPLTFCSGIIMAIFSFYFVFKSIAKIGEAYDFGVGMGCLTMIIATVMIGLINALLAGVFGNTVVNAITNLLAVAPS